MNNIYKIDRFLLRLFHRLAEPVARLSFFIIYFWFGLLKVIGESPAEPLVRDLFNSTFIGNVLSFPSFYIFFGIFEMLIGIMFLIPHLERVALLVLSIHLITTVMPLFLLSSSTWKGFLIPTMEGQYIIKNLLFVGLAMATTLHLHPLRREYGGNISV